MSHSYDVYAETWEKHDGRHVTVGELRCKIQVRSYVAAYPYRHRVITVHAVPTRIAKRSESYLRVKRELGDDWSTDILASDCEVECDILEQLGE